ncbi:hypothetical protein HMPREF1585_00711 [Gardnerella vaginalis JCP8481B]|nr:hypothetical protein HMPREF1585_00711 [Gardnerella vaginalis JCP8481B]
MVICLMWRSKLGELFSRWRDDLLERSTARAKATRSVSLLRVESTVCFNASSVASALSARAFLRAVALMLVFVNQQESTSAEHNCKTS